MTITYRLYGPTPEEAARILGQASAQARRDRTREFIRSTARQMCIDAGRDVPEALLP